MITAVDVYYSFNKNATASAIVFLDYSDSTEYKAYLKVIPEVEDYIPGEFYKRELPCLLAIISLIEEEIDTIIIDGYIDPGNNPGLGRHLWWALDCKKKIIGVAKKYFRDSDAVQVFRGESRQPLYVTSAGIEKMVAAGYIKSMHGNFRIPTLLKKADYLSRYGNSKLSSPVR